MKIENDEHVFIAGMTGSGKTFLAEQYLNGFDNVIVIDTKGFFFWESATEDIEVFETLDELMQFKEGKAIYRPIFQELNFEFYNEFFRWVYLRGNTVVVIDELMQVIENPRKIPEWYIGLMTRGRQLGISVWNLTQRPSGIPMISMSEATHFFIFRLQLKDDRDRIAKIIGYDEVMENAGAIKEYIFWYYNSKIANKPVKAKLTSKGGK